MSKRGFTLLEILVVIAIVVILASIALTFLGGARDQGSDASIKGELSQLAKQAELYYSDKGLYVSASCGASAIRSCALTLTPSDCAGSGGTDKFFRDDSQAKAILAQTFTNTSDSSGLTTSLCRGALGANGSWATAIKLKTASPTTGNALWWCVESSGRAVLEDRPLPFTGITGPLVNSTDNAVAVCR